MIYNIREYNIPEVVLCIIYTYIYIYIMYPPLAIRKAFKYT